MDRGFDRNLSRREALKTIIGAGASFVAMGSVMGSTGRLIALEFGNTSSDPQIAPAETTLPQIEKPRTVTIPENPRSKDPVWNMFDNYLRSPEFKQVTGQIIKAGGEVYIMPRSWLGRVPSDSKGVITRHNIHSFTINPPEDINSKYWLRPGQFFSGHFQIHVIEPILSIQDGREKPKKTGEMESLFVAKYDPLVSTDKPVIAIVQRAINTLSGIQSFPFVEKLEEPKPAVINRPI